jgi:plasmid stabilization system protein ParE
MKKYRVVMHPEAEIDIISSYRWGTKNWGEERAKAWVNELRKTILTRLTSLPLRCPAAPESDELGRTVRQLIVQRYRVLFTVDKQTVTILHVRGSYSRTRITEVQQQ